MAPWLPLDVPLELGGDGAVSVIFGTIPAKADYAAMEAADIPEKVAYIGKGAYTDCRSLKEVTIRSKPEFIGNNAFRNCDKAVITLTAVKKQDKNWNGQWADKRCEVKYSK